MITKKHNIGIKFRSIVYDITDIRIVWYDNHSGSLCWKLYSDVKGDYSIDCGQEVANKYIDFINKYKYDKIIKYL